VNHVTDSKGACPSAGNVVNIDGIAVVMIDEPIKQKSKTRAKRMKPGLSGDQPRTAKQLRQMAAARGRAERERRIAADRINHQRATAAFLEWVSPTPRKERVSTRDAASNNGGTNNGSSHAVGSESAADTNTSPKE
jgi:hypothetical protein